MRQSPFSTTRIFLTLNTDSPAIKSMPRTPIRGRSPGAECGGSTHHRPVLITSLEKLQTTSRETNVARGLVPRLGGEQPGHTTIPRPSHLKILDTQH